MAFDVDTKDGLVEIAISGDLCVDKAVELKGHILAASTNDLVLDMGQTVTIDACAMQVLVAAIKRWHDDGKLLKVLNASSLVNDNIRLMGFASLWESVTESEVS